MERLKVQGLNQEPTLRKFSELIFLKFLLLKFPGWKTIIERMETSFYVMFRHKWWIKMGWRPKVSCKIG